MVIQVRYLWLKDPEVIWIEEPERRKQDLLCPKDCSRHCYLVFNLAHNPLEYVFQVRAKVDDVWNQWRTAARLAVIEQSDAKRGCCIVPPPYIVENIGTPGTFWEVDVSPANTDKNVS